jgi:hypothetical protein
MQPKEIKRTSQWSNFCSIEEEQDIFVSNVYNLINHVRSFPNKMEFFRLLNSENIDTKNPGLIFMSNLYTNQSKSIMIVSSTVQC